MQLDYQLSGYTFNGLAAPSAVLHIKRFAVDDTDHATVDVEIYANAAQLASDSPLAAASYGYTVTDGQTASQIFVSLQSHPDAGPILVGATAVQSA